MTSLMILSYGILSMVVSHINYTSRIFLPSWQVQHGGSHHLWLHICTLQHIAHYNVLLIKFIILHTRTLLSHFLIICYLASGDILLLYNYTQIHDTGEIFLSKTIFLSISVNWPSLFVWSHCSVVNRFKKLPRYEWDLGGSIPGERCKRNGSAGEQAMVLCW